MADILLSKSTGAGTVAPRPPDGVARERANILDLVRSRGGVTRSSIAHETGLSRSVVAQRLNELVASGLLREAGLAASSGGRPPRRLELAADAGCLLAADLGATSIDVAITDLGGRIRAHHAEPCDIARGADVVLGRVERLFDKLLQRTQTDSGPVWGIGVGVPGPVEFTTGRPVAPPIMPGWDDYPIRERLANRYQVPVWVDNDVNVMALGERAAGAAQGEENVVFVKIGSGIGAGLISHGRLHRGAQGSAGDVGHIQIVDDPAVICRCGKIGCLEAIAGGAAIGRAAERLAREGRSEWLAAHLAHAGALTAADVAEAARHGDLASIDVLRKSGRWIGHMLATCVNIFNPSLLVVGGGVAEAGDVLMAGIREVVYGRSLPLATRHLVIKSSVLGSTAGVVGAATMVLDELFDHDRMARWIEAGTPSILAQATTP